MSGNNFQKYFGKIFSKHGNWLTFLLILISSNAFKALLRGHSRGAFKAKSLLPTLLSLSLCPAWHRQLGYICWLAVVRKHTLAAAAATPLSGQVAQRVCSQMRQLMLLDGGKQTTHKHTHTVRRNDDRIWARQLPRGSIPFTQTSPAAGEAMGRKIGSACGFAPLE